MPHVESEHLAKMLNEATHVTESMESYCREREFSPADATLILQAASLMMLIWYRNDKSGTDEQIIEQYNKATLYLFDTIERAEAEHAEKCNGHDHNHKPD